MKNGFGVCLICSSKNRCMCAFKTRKHVFHSCIWHILAVFTGSWVATPCNSSQDINTKMYVLSQMLHNIECFIESRCAHAMKEHCDCRLCLFTTNGMIFIKASYLKSYIFYGESLFQWEKTFIFDGNIRQRLLSDACRDKNIIHKLQI